MNCSIASRELELYASNTEAFIAPVIKTLSKHYRNGEFSYDRALAYIDRYCLVSAAKQYDVEHGTMRTKWNVLFPKNVRMEAAESILDSWLVEFRLGNFWD